MDRLGLVARAGDRTWRAYAAPAALLLAATVAIAFIRGELRGNSHPAAALTPPVVHIHVTHHHAAKAHTLYVVRAGDTIEGISVKTGVPQTQIRSLNPNVTPTALFIGEKLRLR